MGNGGIVRRPDLIDGVLGAALVLLSAGALVLSVRLGSGAGARGGDVLAELRARSEKRILTEREQIRPLIDAAARGEGAAARSGAETALERLAGNSQLHLLLAGQLREEGRVGPALRQYRRAVELSREYADRRSPYFIGHDLKAFLREAQPALEAAGNAEALGDLHALQRFLAGGCG
jgi:hypothetical protein